MRKYIIDGGKPLTGKVHISGAKNAAVAILPAALLVDGVCRLENIPEISDVTALLDILQQIGATVRYLYPSCVEVDCRHIRTTRIPQDLAHQIRASYYFIGALLGRFGEAEVSMPGGCNFGGVRPIDQHIKGFEAMHAEVCEGDFICAHALSENHRMQGSHVYLDVISVGATMNLIMAAVLAEGTTVIENAAREPHVVDLANFLNSMGAEVRGAGTETIHINGVEKLHGGAYAIIPDQIEAGTYMAAVCATGGEVLVSGVIPKHMDCITAKLCELGADIKERDDSLLIRCNGILKKTNVKTYPYPGFPTDMQPQIAVCLCLAEGVSFITEGVWDNRYRYVGELRKMGAKVYVDGHTAVVEGVKQLTAAKVQAHDLRAGAAMVIAALAASGTSEIVGVRYIERGYENIVEKLQSLGAEIRSEEIPKTLYRMIG